MLNRQVFDPETERSYQDNCSERALSLIRYGAVTGIVLFLFTAFFEIFVLESMVNVPMAWVTAIVSGISIAILGALTYIDYFRKNVGMLLAMGAVVITLNNIFDYPLYYESASYSFVLTQITGLYILSVVAPNCPTVLLCSIICVFAPIPMAYLLGINGMITANGYYYLVMVVSTICIMSYFFDQKNRRSYSLELALEDDREQMKQLAIRDALTGCYNRRHFYDTLDQEYDKAKRYGNALAIVMIDVDHFKQINDNFGHAAGDKALCEIAQKCQGMMRSSDTLARVGGEEFALLLPHTDRNSALFIAERLRKRIKNLSMSVNESETISLTVSLGVSVLGKADTDLDELFQQADEALYESKRNGRNRVSFYQATAA